MADKSKHFPNHYLRRAKLSRRAEPMDLLWFPSMKYSGSHQYRQSNINESGGIFPSGSENGEKRSKQDKEFLTLNIEDGGNVTG